jgi:hypothetical protein
MKTMQSLGAFAWIVGEGSSVYLRRWSIQVRARAQGYPLSRDPTIIPVGYEGTLETSEEIEGLDVACGRRIAVVPYGEDQLGWSGIIDSAQYRVDTEYGVISCKMELADLQSVEPACAPLSTRSFRPSCVEQVSVVQKPPPTPLPKTPRMIRLDDA